MPLIERTAAQGSYRDFGVTAPPETAFGEYALRHPAGLPLVREVRL